MVDERFGGHGRHGGGDILGDEFFRRRARRKSRRDRMSCSCRRDSHPGEHYADGSPNPSAASARPAHPARRPRRSRSATPSGPVAPVSPRPRQRGDFVVGDAAFRPDDQHHRIGLRQRQFGQRLGGGLVQCQHDGARRDVVGHPPAPTRRVDTTPVTGGICARRDCRAAERATARQRRSPLSTRACPSQRATQRDACQATKAVRPGLGGQFDRQLGAIRLRQRLHDGDGGSGGRHGRSGPAPAPTAGPCRRPR